MQYCIIILRIVFDRRNFLWAQLTAPSCLAGMCPGTAAGILPAEEAGLVQLALGNRWLTTSHNSVSDFSGHSCPGQTTVCLPTSYSPSPTVVACVFITAIQPVHSAHLSITSCHLSTHFTITGTAPPKKKQHFTTPQFHWDTLPRLEQHHPPLFLATALSDTTTVAADLEFAVAMEDAIWSL